MTETTFGPISFEEFRRLVAQELQVDEARVVPEASFIADLQADSIRLVELLLRLEEAGIHIPLEEAWDVETVGDAYELYLRQAQSGHGFQSLASLP
jgi:acyl carrier protein